MQSFFLSLNHKIAQNLIKTASFHITSTKIYLFSLKIVVILVFLYKSFNMIEQIITHQFVTTAQAADTSFNAAEVQHEA